MGACWSRMSWSDKQELWARWRRGESLSEISRALHRVASVVYDVVGAEGGIAPRPRRRSRLALTTTEREEISRRLPLCPLVALLAPPTRRQFVSCDR
jgi:hypothetical protein